MRIPTTRCTRRRPRSHGRRLARQPDRDSLVPPCPPPRRRVMYQALCVCVGVCWPYVSRVNLKNVKICDWGRPLRSRTPARAQFFHSALHTARSAEIAHTRPHEPIRIKPIFSYYRACALYTGGPPPMLLACHAHGVYLADGRTHLTVPCPDRGHRAGVGGQGLSHTP